ncbi:MAG: cell division protein FtsZ, partial [Chloroflexota bacterium]
PQRPAQSQPQQGQNQQSQQQPAQPQQPQVRPQQRQSQDNFAARVYEDDDMDIPPFLRKNRK